LATYGVLGKVATAEYGVGKDKPRGTVTPVDNFYNLEIVLWLTPKVLPISVARKEDYWAEPSWRAAFVGLTNTCLGALHLS
jgi:hypothetical protein